MNARELNAEDIEVFSSAIAEFFETTSGERARVRSAYLLETSAPMLDNDYSGIINIAGGYTGTVCFSAPKGLLTHILLICGESAYSEESHLDIVGEIANTLSGRARKHFGEALEISTPRAFAGQQGAPSPRVRSLPYAIPFTWHGYEAGLVVSLTPNEQRRNV